MTVRTSLRGYPLGSGPGYPDDILTRPNRRDVRFSIEDFLHENPQVLKQKGLPRGVTQVGYLVGLPPRRANFDVRIPKPVVDLFGVCFAEGGEGEEGAEGAE